MASFDNALRPIEARSVSDQVTVELRRSILCGALAPGQKFSLREISALLNVSFIPVREALRSLEAEGLIVTRPGHSAAVAPLDLGDLHSIYRLRRTLEPELAGRACLLLTDAELDRLDHLAADFGDEGQGMQDIYDDHHEFHLALLAPATSAWDLRILTTLWRAGERYIRIGFSLLDPDPDEAGRRERVHEGLVDVFRQRDPQAAAEAVHEHLIRNERLALRALETLPAGRVDGDQPVTPDGGSGARV